MSAAGTTALAVLIDAQNISHIFADDLFRQIDKLGIASIRHVYADWSRPDANGWKAVLQRHALRPMQQFDNVAGKDVADMMLIIDAMDLLHRGDHSGFCLVSSDSDFSALAIRIRQSGAKVFGLGESKAPQSFRRACNRFVVLGKPAKVAMALKTTPPAQPATPKSGVASVPISGKAPLSVADLATLRAAISQTADPQGWADVSALGTYLAQNTGLIIRKHAANLSKLLRVSGIAEIETDSASRVRARIRLAG